MILDKCKTVEPEPEVPDLPGEPVPPLETEPEPLPENNPELDRYDHHGFPESKEKPSGNGGIMFENPERLEKFRLSWLASMNAAVQKDRKTFYGILGGLGYSASTEVPREYNEMRKVYQEVKKAGLLDSIEQ